MGITDEKFLWGLYVRGFCGGLQVFEFMVITGNGILWGLQVRSSYRITGKGIQWGTTSKEILWELQVRKFSGEIHVREFCRGLEVKGSVGITCKGFLGDYK